ncbi:MAG: adenosylhomocysteinase [Planctomycetota bacterium]|jgi:adenosylhomocysteinase
MDYDIKDASLASGGAERIEWADRDMPVLALVRKRFAEEKPLEGRRMAACLHITAETANLARTLCDGGADLVLCASNPLSTQDDVAAALVSEYEIPVFAVRGEDRDTYYSHIEAALARRPTITMDDGADLVNVVHSKYSERAGEITASMEETTTGVIRLRAMEEAGALLLPVFAVNDATTKHLFDNRYGTGQSTMDGIVRATDALIAGKKIVVAGYGWCGRGVASRARGMGAIVIVAEVDPLRALEAAMDGFLVMPMQEAALHGDIFITVTGDVHVVREEHFRVMKDGAVVCNSGHFNVEVDLEALDRVADTKNLQIKDLVDEYIVEGKRIYVLGEGRLINLAAAHGHPASVMDMSFATQALVSEYAVKNSDILQPRVYDVPRSIEEWVSRLKLDSMGISIDSLTAEQEKYLSSFDVGT